MNNIKTIGGAGGIFHILVPGVFLLLNIIATIYFFPFTDVDTRKNIITIFSNQTIGLVFTICFGYLMGVVLRIFRSESADRWSAWFLCRFDKTAKKPQCKQNLYAYEKFPYTEWMGEIASRLPKDAQEFYTRIWAKGNNKTFFSFCKVLIISEDERAANEIYSVEALCRYISGMLYALFAASGLLFIVLLTQVIVLKMFNIAISVLLVGYLVAIIGILHNFRFMRLKETSTVFSAAYKNRHLFETPQASDGVEKKSLTTGST